MTIEFKVTPTGLECAHELNAMTSETVHFSPRLNFKATGIRVEGTRMYELMIRDARIGFETVVGTAVSLSVLKCLKEFVDLKIVGKDLKVGDVLRYTINNTGKQRLVFTIFIDGNWIP
jgi:hypothetical protein